MNNLEIFLNLNQNEINTILIDKEKKNQIFNKDFNINNNFSDTKKIIDNLNQILKSLIIELEKKISKPISKINLMIDNPHSIKILPAIIVIPSQEVLSETLAITQSLIIFTLSIIFSIYALGRLP